MSRTIKQTLARAFHKVWKAAMRARDYTAMQQVRLDFPLEATQVTRYGVKRHYEAGIKIKSRRSARMKLKEADREEIWYE